MAQSVLPVAMNHADVSVAQPKTKPAFAHSADVRLFSSGHLWPIVYLIKRCMLFAFTKILIAANILATQFLFISAANHTLLTAHAEIADAR